MRAFHRLRFRSLKRLQPLGLSRRHFLQGSAGLAALPMLLSCRLSGPPESELPLLVRRAQGDGADASPRFVPEYLAWVLSGIVSGTSVVLLTQNIV